MEILARREDFPDRGSVTRCSVADRQVPEYTVFLDPATSELFAYAEIESEERWNAIGATDVCRRWWRSMREIMPANPDNSPVSAPLKEVFHLEST